MSGRMTADNLLEIAQKMADEKLAKEKQLVTEKINSELSDVEKAIEMVRSGLCYKKVDEYGVNRYLFATEEMLVHDYLSEPENTYTPKGIRFSDDRERDRYDYIFRVNGIYYFDIRYILNAYTEDVRKEHNRIIRYNEQLGEMTREFDRLLKEHHAIKKMLDDWTARQERGGEVE